MSPPLPTSPTPAYPYPCLLPCPALPGPRRDCLGGGGARRPPVQRVSRQDDPCVGRWVAALREGARGAHAPGFVARNLKRPAVLGVL
eukprot:160128-Chlamydomonas_euryale.AAC.2